MSAPDAVRLRPRNDDHRLPAYRVDAKFGTYRLQNAGPLYVYGSLGVIMLWGAWMTVALEDDS